MHIFFPFESASQVYTAVNLFQVKYIAQCIEEIKAELKQENIAVKANAVAKLSYVCSPPSRHLLLIVNFYKIGFLFKYLLASNDWL